MGFPQPTSSPDNSPLSKRRRFQPSTLSPMMPYADNASIENNTFDSPLILPEHGPLPEDIERDLLQVGMRVRKAVPEGYKNSQTFKPRPFFNMRRLSPATQAALSSGNTTSIQEVAPYSAGSLHKIGGMAVQPISTATFCGINLATLAQHEGWSSPSPFSQQSLWSYSTSHKRNHELEDDSDEQDWLPETPVLDATSGFNMPMPPDYFAIDMENMSDVSPMTQIRREAGHPFKQRDMSDLNVMSNGNGRRVAKPKSRVRGTNAVASPPTSAFNPFANMAMLAEQQQESMVMSFGQQQQHGHGHGHGHSRMLSCGMEAALNMNMAMAMNDFSDAGFLQRREDVEMDCS